MQSVGYSTSFPGIIDPGDPPCSPPTLLSLLLSYSLPPPLFPPSVTFKTAQDTSWLGGSQQDGVGPLTLQPPFPSSVPLPSSSCLQLLHKGIHVAMRPVEMSGDHYRNLCGRCTNPPPLSFCFCKCPTPHTRCLVMLFLLSQLQVLMRWDSLFTTVLLAGLQQAVLFIYSWRSTPFNLNRPMHRSITGECMENKRPTCIPAHSAVDYLSNPPTQIFFDIFVVCSLLAPLSLFFHNLFLIVSSVLLSV